MLTELSLVVFVLSSGLFVHTYILYPVTLRCLSALRQSPEIASSDTYPRVAIVVAAYNEESIIAEKIENTLALEYPGRLDIVVFSDASSDRTDDIVRQYVDRGVELKRIEGRVGKTECQNRVVADLAVDVVVFSDANSMYEPDAVERLVERIDAGADCAVGELRYRDGDAAGESLYWRYERTIKQLEDDTGTSIAGNGAIYAVQRDSYVTLAREEISDFAEPLAVIQSGGDVAYAEDAVARESTAGSVRGELSRRTRIATRSWHTLWRYRELLNPISHPGVAYRIWSHKVLRWLSPALLVLVLVSTVSLTVLRDGVLFPALAGAQILCYGLAGAGWILEDRIDRLPLVVHIPYYFLVANYGLTIGLLNFIRGRNVVVWETDDASRRGPSSPGGDK